MAPSLQPIVTCSALEIIIPLDKSSIKPLQSAKYKPSGTNMATAGTGDYNFPPWGELIPPKKLL